MATPRASSRPLLLAILFSLLVCVFAAPALASKSQPAAPADVELICHTSNPDECYPKIFQPTDEFQTVHDDQEIPPGLHVRLNISTGKKEAKINHPDEVSPELEGLPVDHSVVVVDPEQPEEPQIPKGAPAYGNAGKVKEPEDKSEGAPFFEAVRLLKSSDGENGAGFDEALEGMEELSHDIYYGLQITEDTEVLKALFCLMGDESVPTKEGVIPRGHQAASILAGALQNNPTALNEVVEQWPSLMVAQCPKTGKPLRDSLYATFVPAGPETEAADQASASKAKAKVSAINGLIKSDAIREAFLASDGMRRLLEVLVPEGKAWATAQRKVGELVLDTFLDEDMGATLGQWPRTARASDAQCQTGETKTDEGCWDYHVEKIMKANRWNSGHWSKDLYNRLAVLRKSGDAAGHADL